MGSRTTRADAASAAEAPVERLLRLCEEERELYVRVLTYARQQGELVRQGAAMSQVRRVLEGKRQCLEEIARLEAEEEALRKSGSEDPGDWAPADRVRLHAARARITSLVEEILACDERNDRELLAQARLM